MNLPVNSEVCSPAGCRRPSSGSVDKGKTGGQKALKGCEKTVVLPTSSPGPALPGAELEGVGFEESWCMAQLARSQEKGWLLFTCRRVTLASQTQHPCEGKLLPHVFKPNYQRLAENLWTTTCLFATNSHFQAEEEAGRLERKRPCPLESPVPGFCYSYPGGLFSQKPKTFCLELDGFWRTVWLVTGLGAQVGEWDSQQSLGLGLVAATVHPSTCLV